jgi:hypothetical protein
MNFPKLAVAATAYVFEQNDIQTGRVWFEGECDLIVIKTNVAELIGEPVVFYGETKSNVVEQIINHLKSMGLTGKLKVK